MIAKLYRIRYTFPGVMENRIKKKAVKRRLMRHERIKPGVGRLPENSVKLDVIACKTPGKYPIKGKIAYVISFIRMYEIPNTAAVEYEKQPENVSTTRKTGILVYFA